MENRPSDRLTAMMESVSSYSDLTCSRCSTLIATQLGNSSVSMIELRDTFICFTTLFKHFSIHDNEVKRLPSAPSEVHQPIRQISSTLTKAASRQSCTRDIITIYHKYPTLIHSLAEVFTIEVLKFCVNCGFTLFD